LLAETDTGTDTDSIMTNTDEQLRLASEHLVDSALRLAAYIEGVTTTGAGQKSTARNMVADVQQKADAARRALNRMKPG
jgi:hypothetical protein